MMGCGASAVSSFVANSMAFEAVCMEIDATFGSPVPQPVLIIGQEGSGKTTLFRRLLTKYPDLDFVWIDGRFIFSFEDIIEKVAGKSIFIIDNLDYFLTRCSYDEQYRLRGLLYNEVAPMMIAGVSKLMPALTEYRAPFFGGFKNIHLPLIGEEELTKIFGDECIDRARDMFKLLPPTIKSVEIISRIIEAGGDPKNDLGSLLSYYSSVYRIIYNSLPTNSQHILNILSNSEKEMTLSDIKEAAGLPSGILTPYLKSLKKKGMIKIDNSVRRSTKYIMKDPLFKIWLKEATIKSVF